MERHRRKRLETLARRVSAADVQLMVSQNAQIVNSSLLGLTIALAQDDGAGTAVHREAVLRQPAGHRHIVTVPPQVGIDLLDLHGYGTKEVLRPLGQLESDIPR